MPNFVNRFIKVLVVERLEEIEVKKLIQSGYFPVSDAVNEIIQERINNNLPFQVLDFEGSVFDDAKNAYTHYDITFLIEEEEYMICGVSESCLLCSFI